MPHKSAKEEILKRINEREGNAVFVGTREIDVPRYGEVTLTFHDGQLRYVETRTKEKVE